MTIKTILALAAIAWSIPALAQDRPAGLKDPDQNRPLAVPT